MGVDGSWRIGVVDALQAGPQLRKKRYQQPVETRITVNCKTGERTVERIEEAAREGIASSVVRRPAKPPHVRPRPILKLSLARPYRIIACVAYAWELRPDQLTATTRVKRISWPRFAACKILHEELGFSYPKIMPFVGFRDHTSVIHGLGRAQFLIKTNPDYARRYALALDVLAGRAKVEEELA